MDKFTARRRLLRGSLSAPLVLTVASSPAAAAARGSWEACLLRAGKDEAVMKVNPPAPWIDGDDHDTWLRLRVPLFKGQLNSQGTSSGDIPTAEGEGSVTSSGQAASETQSTDSAAPIQPVEAEQTTAYRDFYQLPGDEKYYPKEPEASEECVGYADVQIDGLARYEDGREIQLLVYVDNTGAVVARGPCASLDGEGFPVSGSCWASFGGMQV